MNAFHNFFTISSMTQLNIHPIFLCYSVPGCDEDDGHSVDTTTSGPVPMATTCTDAVNQVRCQEGKVETCQWNVFLAT